MDLSLALIEEDHGSRLALEVARDFVLYLRRPGGQSQFSAALSLQATDSHPFRDLVAWVLDNLNAELNVGVLAERVSMSPRNFARVFTKEMRTTPAVFVERLRVDRARRRLEESAHSLKVVAAQCGFKNVASMRSALPAIAGSAARSVSSTLSQHARIASTARSALSTMCERVCDLAPGKLFQDDPQLCIRKAFPSFGTGATRFRSLLDSRVRQLFSNP